MTCAEILGRLSAGIDGELTRSEAAEVRSHMDTCASCGRREARLRQTRDAFRVAARRSAGPPILAATAAGILAIAFSTGLGRMHRGPEHPTTKRGEASVVMPSERGGFNPAETTRALIGLDCGLPQAVECVMDRPCADGRCGPGASDLILPRRL